jgi:hypothetical protein
MRFRSTFLVAITLAAIATSVSAQGDPSVGIRETATLLGDLPNGRAAGFLAGKGAFLLLPGIIGANGATIYGSDFGGTVKPSSDFGVQLKGTIGTMDLGAESKARFGGELKLTKAISKLSLAGVAAYVKTADISGKTTLTGAGEFEFWTDKNKANRLSIGFTGNHVTKSPEGGSSESGFTFLPGLVWMTGSTTRIAADYQLDSDIDDEDNFSFSVVQALNGVRGTPSLILAAAKHRTIIAKILYIR